MELTLSSEKGAGALDMPRGDNLGESGFLRLIDDVTGAVHLFVVQKVAVVELSGDASTTVPGCAEDDEYDAIEYHAEKVADLMEKSNPEACAVIEGRRLSERSLSVTLNGEVVFESELRQALGFAELYGSELLQMDISGRVQVSIR